jgi:hypothetical protein
LGERCPEARQEPAGSPLRVDGEGTGPLGFNDTAKGIGQSLNRRGRGPGQLGARNTDTKARSWDWVPAATVARTGPE